jgi:hypothetical protein
MARRPPHALDLPLKDLNPAIAVARSKHVEQNRNHRIDKASRHARE